MSNILKTLAAGSVSGDYQIERSLRFNSADSAYLSRTPASAGNRKTWTWSGWVKLGDLTKSGTSGWNTIFGAYTDNNNRLFAYTRDSTNGNVFQIFNNTGGSTNLQLVSNQVFRDASSWYHFVVALDTTQATSADRCKVYVNGSQIISWATATYPAQNADLFLNNNNVNLIGANYFSGLSLYHDGYLTEVHFVDGQALTPSSFGEVDSVTGVWKPIAYAGTYGTNGFHLDFSDNSSTTALGYDAAGSNDWTPNNFSVTAGAGNDSLVDTPTQYGTDTGAGGEVRGNYATLNPLIKGGDAVLSNGNLDVVGSGSAGVYANVRSTIQIPTSGKWYCEFRVNAQASGNPNIGILSEAVSLTTYTSSEGVLFIRPKGTDADRPYWVVDTTDASIRVNTTAVAAGDIFQVIYDADNLKVWMGINNTYYGISGGSTVTVSASDIASGTNPAYTISSTKRYYFGGVVDQSGDGFSANFGQRPFAYTAPSGFKALCTTNLPDPTVVQGDDYFNTVLYTGNGTSQSITGVGFQPDFVWIKQRNSTEHHVLTDAVRGATKMLRSSTTDAEVTDATLLTAFNSDGFTVGSELAVNRSGYTYAAWNWKANGAGVSNTDGTITSTVSANTTAGISIVTYTGNGSAGATIGHGLGSSPKMIIVQTRTGTNNRDKPVYHSSVGNTAAMILNQTGAYDTWVGYWNNTSPTSTVFTVGNDQNTNTNTSTYVAYCFAEVEGFSKFGSYTGNGSTDGLFVYTGFRPAWIMIKRSSSTSNWVILDLSRGFNTQYNELKANLSDAEVSFNDRVDLLSNGFKLRASSFPNDSGVSFIYAAFSSNPFKYSLAR